MAKTLTPDTEHAGKRKKLAKREAKVMLKVEQAKKDVQKAEQKAAKAQAKLEEMRTRLHNLEQALDQTRAPQEPELPQEAQLQPLAIEESAQHNGATQGGPFTGTPATDDSSAATTGQQVVEANEEEHYLTQAESDTTTEPTGEWGDTSKDANLFTDTDLSAGSLSPEDVVVYHLTDDVTASDATPTSEDTTSHSAPHNEEHDASTTNNEHTSDDTTNSAAPATSEGN